jgi:hypothetical protein
MVAPIGRPGLPASERRRGRRQWLPTRAGLAQEEKREEGEKGRARGPTGIGLAAESEEGREGKEEILFYFSRIFKAFSN